MTLNKSRARKNSNTQTDRTENDHIKGGVHTQQYRKRDKHNNEKIKKIKWNVRKRRILKAGTETEGKKDHH